MNLIVILLNSSQVISVPVSKPLTHGSQALLVGLKLKQDVRTPSGFVTDEYITYPLAPGEQVNNPFLYHYYLEISQLSASVRNSINGRFPKTTRLIHGLYCTELLINCETTPVFL